MERKERLKNNFFGVLRHVELYNFYFNCINIVCIVEIVLFFECAVPSLNELCQILTGECHFLYTPQTYALEILLRNPIKITFHFKYQIILIRNSQFYQKIRNVKNLNGASDKKLKKN